MDEEFSLAAVIGLLVLIGVGFDVMAGRTLDARGKRLHRRALWVLLVAGFIVVLLVLPE